MEKIQIKFNGVEDVNKFVHIISKYDADFDLYCGSYCVDAKSILGILTMDLRNKMWMTMNCGKDMKQRVIRDLTRSSAVAVA